MRTSPNRRLAVTAGVLYLGLGLAGFFVTAGVGFFETPGGLLFGVLEVNPSHNVAHLLIGAGLLVAGLLGVRPAKTANVVVGTAFLALGLAGLFVVGSEFNILAINGAGNVLHFGSAALLLAVGLGADLVAKPRGDAG